MDPTPVDQPDFPFRRLSATPLSDLSPPSSPPIRPPQQTRQGSAHFERRSSASSLAVPTRTTSKVSPFPADDYDYGDVGPSPEGSATTERENANLKQHVPDLQLDGRAAPYAQTEPEKVVEDSKPPYYERQGRRRRAEVPDEENPSFTNGVVHQTEDIAEAPAAAQLPASQRSRWQLRRKRPKEPAAVELKEHPKLRHVMLHWGKENVDGAQRLIVNATLPSVADRRSDSQNHVVWQHSELEDISFEKLESIVNRSRSQGLQESEIGLTRRLLKRVRKTAERDFVGGSFLTPLALRYDILDDSRYSVDKCCIFLGFPYFDIHKAQLPKLYKKGDVEHPERTLLQSRYRLNETAERDQSQCLRMLQGEADALTSKLRKALKACIDAQNPHCDQPMPSVTEELIHVPQLWALIMGVDRMITAGPISDMALQGSSINIKDTVEMAGDAKRCSLVRISFINRGKLQELTYPIEQCASWFGLLNKHQQIRGILKKDTEKGAKADGQEYDPHEYKLEIRGHVIDGRTWASVQRLAEAEVLNIWMRTPKRKVPRVSVKMDGESDSASAEHTDDETKPDGLTTAAAAEFPLPNPIPVVSAFLDWRILDEFGEPDNCPVNEKLNRFLNAIYRSLPAICHGAEVDPPADRARLSRHRHLGKESARPKLSVYGKSSTEVESLVLQLCAGYTGNLPAVEQELFSEFKKIFDYFIPKNHNHESGPIRLFWGALYDIMSYRPYLEQFLEKTKGIASRAEHIHLGVFQQLIGRNSELANVVSDSAVLLSSMVDAIGAVFNMLVEAVRDVRQGRQDASTQRSTCGKKVLSSYDEACKLLEQAKNELISEATGAAPGENIGPVLTPEAILIMLMERLVHGVFREGTVDVINIFEECLEHLALRVKDRASRRLLQMVNAFEEEVSIVNDVLLQQKKVLLDFRDYLNPTSFKNPSIARKMRFDFERKGIERILLSIEEKLHDCTELRDRARVLAKQNVQLVETLQDDNNRAIFIFTFITILFLPLSFVAGFFGMNLAGISGTTQSVSHFWYIGLPVTAVIMALCIGVMIKGEDLWFALKLMPKNIRKTFAHQGKRKLA